MMRWRSWWQELEVSQEGWGGLRNIISAKEGEQRAGTVAAVDVGEPSRSFSRTGSAPPLPR